MSEQKQPLTRWEREGGKEMVSQERYNVCACASVSLGMVSIDVAIFIGGQERKCRSQRAGLVGRCAEKQERDAVKSSRVSWE